MNDEQRSARWDERTERRDELEHAVGSLSFLRECARTDHRHDARFARSDDAWSFRIDGRRPTGVGIPSVDELSRVVTDELDHRRHPQRLADVVHVDHQGRNARQHEDVRRRHGDARNLSCAVALVHDFADRQHGVHEGCDEEADRELTGLVAKDALHDPGRELPHRQLDDDHRDGEYERRKAHHRDRDRVQDRRRRGRSTDDLLRDRLIVEGSVEGDRAKGDRRAREDTHDRHEPKARPDTHRELSQPHEPRAYPPRRRPMRRVTRWSGSREMRRGAWRAGRARPRVVDRR